MQCCAPASAGGLAVSGERTTDQDTGYHERLDNQRVFRKDKKVGCNQTGLPAVAPFDWIGNQIGGTLKTWVCALSDVEIIQTSGMRTIMPPKHRKK